VDVDVDVDVVLLDKEHLTCRIFPLIWTRWTVCGLLSGASESVRTYDQIMSLISAGRRRSGDSWLVCLAQGSIGAGISFLFMSSGEQIARVWIRSRTVSRHL
jgi:hypothetical protein